jgi:hypothetical protein
MDPEDPDGPSPSVVQYRSSPTALPFHNHNHNFDLKKDRVDRGDYLKSLRPGEWGDEVAVDHYCLLLFIFVHWWQSTFRLTGEGKPAVSILPTDFSRKIEIKVDKDKETEGTGYSGYTEGIPYWDIWPR